VADAAADALELARLQRWRLRKAAQRMPRRRVLALGIERTDLPNLLSATHAELLRSRHEVRFASTPAGGQGKFENLNALLGEYPVTGSDWLVVVDDDVALPPGFLDTFLFLAERFQLQLAQPAHRRHSHAAFEITRRRAGSIVRETGFVEIGPVFAFQAATFDVLLPFPPLRIGWGLDAHWSALARQHGWRLGVIDATPVRHGLRQIASSYNRAAAIDEAREFLATRPYTKAADAQITVATHRTLTTSTSVPVPGQSASEPYCADNVLDRLSSRSSLEHHYAHMLRRERLLLHRRLDRTDGDVLSVGCGWHPGRHLFPAPDFRLVAIDADPARVAGVLSAGRADEAHVGHAGQLDLPDDSFDVVLYRLVLHHIAYRGQLAPCFEEAARVLRPGGALVAIEPGLWHPVGLALALANRTGAATALHGTPDDVPLSPRRLKAEARAAGLTPELHAVTYTWRRMPRLLQRALQPADALGSRPRAAGFGHTLMLIARSA
jgi:SAM-dependent methyltransferase